MERLSGLQEKILKHVCESENQENPTSLVKVLDRNKVTIWQSVNSLVKGKYLTYQAPVHGRVKKTKAITPTEKGIWYCLAYLEVNLYYDYLQLVLEEVRKGNSLFSMTGILWAGFVPMIPFDKGAVSLIIIMRPLAKFYCEYDYFDKEGRLSDSKKLKVSHEEELEQCVLEMLTDSRIEPEIMQKMLASEEFYGMREVTKRFWQNHDQKVHEILRLFD